MIDLTNNSFLRQCTKIFVIIRLFFDISTFDRWKKSREKAFVFSQRRPRVTIHDRYVLSHVKHDFMVRLPKQNRCARMYTSRKVSGSNATLDQTHSASRTHRLHRD